ncbi:MAG: PDZ domain-containing protein [Acidobacteriota bacterium]|nr:PDZ domain-containing protein [Acidobacteriota bacterium]
MRLNRWIGCLVFIVLIGAGLAFGAPAEGTMAFTVSMERPETHYYHVVFRCDGLGGEAQDFKLPVWTPGYYSVLDFARNVVNFEARDGSGRALAWEKTAKNSWRVKTGGAPSLVISYDVYAFTLFVANSYLDGDKGFLSPTSVLMHVGGKLRHPATVTIQPPSGWDRITTGLDPVAGRPNTYAAPDFDVLYDSPFLLGRQEILSFEAGGIPHVFAADGFGALDKAKFTADLKRIVEASAAIIGDIPYKHYAFLAIGPGQGGIEHQNSQAVSFQPGGLETPRGYESWLAFVAHEYFHCYNVKAIRPLALGPFDYDKENYTNMLWVSEGGTVYYEYRVLNQAGLMGREDVLARLPGILAAYENSPGRRFQSATASSWDAWNGYFGGRGGDAANTTISYYDKGAGLMLLLDLAIRHESKNQKSLDDVMRTLYRTYYRDKKRGFTDDEFRTACESAAGASLAEIFEYASTVKDIDYPKYLAYAGLSIDVRPKALPGGYFGASARDQAGSLVISNVERDSPAWLAGLSPQDEIIGLDGVRAGTRMMAEFFAKKRAGDKVTVQISRGGKIREVEVTLGTKTERSFAIKPLPNPDSLQAAILDGLWK